MKFYIFLGDFKKGYELINVKMCSVICNSLLVFRFFEYKYDFIVWFIILFFDI